jgi:hypothetical protein
MKKLIILFISICVFNLLNAQTGIGTTSPNASAKLDVFSDNKGFLPPRVSIDSAKDITSIVNPAEGLLVYNTGTVGLQAGYYYWNGLSWATIATASSAGNGVASSNLVKLYQEGYSITSGSASSTDGYSFTVPVSGRYEFNFNSTGWNSTSGNTVKLTFNVRQGTTVLGSDYHQSASSNVWAEYEGRVEVNLNAGVTYNAQVVTSIGNRNAKDFDKIFYKMVAGNLAVTGQSVDYVSVGSINISGVGGNQDLVFPTNFGGNIPYNTSTGVFTLSANKTYLFQAQVRVNSPSAGGNYIEYGFVDAVSNALLVNGTQTITSSTTSTAGYGSNPVINFIYTPSSNQTVKIRTTSTTAGTQTVVSGTANITQIGSSAIINPWTLSGTNTYNTTGNVGIGTSSPTTTLDVTGSLQVSGNTTLKGNLNIGTGVGAEGGEMQLAYAQTGNTLSGTSVVVDVYQDRLRIFESGGNARGVFLDLAKAPSGVGGELMYKAAGFVNAGVAVTLGDIQVIMSTSGSRSLQIRTTGSSFTGMASAHTTYSNGSYIYYSDKSFTVDANYGYIGGVTWSFGNDGDLSVYYVRDTTNQRFYRFTLMVGNVTAYTNNFISIERLL